jgi:polyhydroxyalkanoate synthase
MMPTAAIFEVMDTVRRAQGWTLAALGFGPSECDYRLIASGSHWRLRDYGGSNRGASVLVVAAPIKRPYIWDLAATVSAVRHCLREQLRMFLLEWAPSRQNDGNAGLDEYADAVWECLANVSTVAEAKGAFVAGHSLGGTLAAIAVAANPANVRGLILLGAPLCFPAATSHFRDSIAAMDPSALSEMKVVPGSFLSQVSALASPETFIWSRYRDALACIGDPLAMDIHARVERWALDEAPLPARLVHQIFVWLYRENRLCRGTLAVHGKAVGPSSLSVPTIAVVNTADEIAPAASVAPFLAGASVTDARLIEYPGESGVALQHLAILAGREAHARLWPEIIAWIQARAGRHAASD